MSKIDENVKGLLNKVKVWTLCTSSGKPNAVPILFKKIDGNDDLVFYDVFMKKTLENIKQNDNVSVVAYDEENLQGYQLKGTAVYSNDEAMVAEGNETTSKFKLTTKGAVIVKVDEVIVLTPGPDIGKVL